MSDYDANILISSAWLILLYDGSSEDDSCRIRPEGNEWRFYHMKIWPDLFGRAVLIRSRALNRLLIRKNLKPSLY